MALTKSHITTETYLNQCILSSITPPIRQPSTPAKTVVRPILPASSSAPYEGKVTTLNPTMFFGTYEHTSRYICICDNMGLQYGISRLSQHMEKEHRIFKNKTIGTWDQSAVHQLSNGNETHSMLTLMGTWQKSTIYLNVVMGSVHRIF